MMGIWKRTEVHRLLILTAARVVIYVYGLIGDGIEVDEYHRQRDIYFFYVAIVSLMLPTIVNTVYMICRSVLKFNYCRGFGKGISKGPFMIVYQLLRQFELMYCLTKKCFHKPCCSEKQEMRQMRRKAQVIEFFEDFYSGFPTLVLHLYILFGSLDWIDGFSINKKPMMHQLYLPALSMLSMLISISSRCASDTRMTSRFTTFISFCGWLCIIVSRVALFAFVASYIRYKLAIVCTVHVVLVSIWICSFAFSPRKKNGILTLLIVILFGLPSLIYYPLMFEFKEGARPYIFFLLITFENFALLGFWALEHLSIDGAFMSTPEVVISSIIIGSTIIGDLFLVLFMLLWYRHNATVPEKMDETDTPIRVNPEKLGIFHYFNDIVFWQERHRPLSCSVKKQSNARKCETDGSRA